MGVEVSRLEKAVVAALAFLGKAPEGAKNILHDILVEEVSFVDEAANRRKFLLFKQASGSGMDKDQEQSLEQAVVDGLVKDDSQSQADFSPGESESEQKALTIPTPVKEALVKIISESVERLVSVGNQVKGAEETSERVGEPLPSSLAREIKAVATMLQGALSRYPSPTAMSSEAEQEKSGADASLEAASETEKAVGKVASTLREVSETAMSLSRAAGEADTLSGAMITALQRLSAKLSSLAEKYPRPTARGSEEGSEKTSSPADEGTIEEPSDEEFERALEKLGGIPTEVSHKMRVLADAMVKIADAPDPVALVRLKDQIAGVAKAFEDRPELSDDDVVGEAMANAVEKAVRPKKLGHFLEALKAVVAALEDYSSKVPAETAKMASRTEPLSPTREPGDMGNIGTGPETDRPAMEDKESAIAEILKAEVASLRAQVAKLASTPQVPASRAEQEVVSGKGVEDERHRRPNPFIVG